MNELIVDYGSKHKSKFSYLLYLVTCVAFFLYACFILIREKSSASDSILVPISIAYIVIALLVLAVTIISNRKKNLLVINNSEIKMEMGNQKFVIEWSRVSGVNVGISYLVFSLDGGQKQQKMDMSGLLYADLKNVKNKVLEVCEHKNIPYKND